MVDGPLGWSYNSDSVGATNSTGPLLVGPPVAAGVEDAYDRYLEVTNAGPAVAEQLGELLGNLLFLVSGTAVGPTEHPAI